MRKPKYYDTRFGEAVRKAVDAGELTYMNVKEWDKAYNGGVAPVPAFNTADIIEYYLNNKKGVSR